MVSTLPIPSAPYGPLKRVDNLLISIHITRIPTGYQQVVHRIHTGYTQDIHRGGGTLKITSERGAGVRAMYPPLQGRSPKVWIFNLPQVVHQVVHWLGPKKYFPYISRGYPKAPKYFGEKAQKHPNIYPLSRVIPCTGFEWGCKGGNRVRPTLSSPKGLKWLTKVLLNSWRS